MKATPQLLEGMEWEPINISFADFNQPGGSSTTVPAGEVEEVAYAEIGEDGQFASYEMIRLGQALDAGNRDSAKGKIFMNLGTGSGEVDQSTEVRYVVRPQNQNSRTALTAWTPLRDLNVTDPQNRIPLTPVTKEGRPAYAKDGRVLALEVRNPSTDVTVDITGSNSDNTTPARAGY